MTRYYYDDAIAAAWMAKAFGFRFESDPDPVIFSFREHAVHGYAKLHLKHSLAYLLMPVKGDKISYSFGVGLHAGEAWDEVKGTITPDDEAYPYNGNGECYILLDCGEGIPFSHLKEIIQRNGKPFFWPLRE